MRRRWHLSAALAFVGAALLAYVALEPPRLYDAEASPETAPPPPAAPRFVETVDLGGFLRGNVHVHTWMSDGDSDPQTVVDWYAANGYDFVAITDHNRRVEPERFPSARADFVVVPGEEVTTVAAGKPVHVNALCTESTIGGSKFKSRPEALSWAVNKIQAQGGVALINHPNFNFALETDHIAAAEGAHLLDVYNGHPQVHNDGNASHTSVETKWQELLDRGIVFAPAAVDDAHAFAPTVAEGIPNSRPGTGWIGVAASERSVEAVCLALREGRVYASSGARIARIRVTASAFEVWLPSAEGTVEFVGRGGAVLASRAPEADGDRWVARFSPHAADGHVRARVLSKDGRAYTPAFRVGR